MSPGRTSDFERAQKQLLAEYRDPKFSHDKEKLTAEKFEVIQGFKSGIRETDWGFEPVILSQNPWG